MVLDRSCQLSYDLGAKTLLLVPPQEIIRFNRLKNVIPYMVSEVCLRVEDHLTDDLHTHLVMCLVFNMLEHGGQAPLDHLPGVLVAFFWNETASDHVT